MKGSDCLIENLIKLASSLIFYYNNTSKYEERTYYVGIDKGFYTLISASTNHEYGIGFSTKIYDRENDLAKN